MTEISLDLKKHCVETAIKGFHDRTLSRYFRSKGKDREAEQRLAVLSIALSQLDFSGLRAAYKALSGDSSAQVILTGTGIDDLAIIIDGERLDIQSFVKR